MYNMTFREFYGTYEEYERSKCLDVIEKQKELLETLRKAYYGDIRVHELSGCTLSDIYAKMQSAERSVDMLQRVIDGKLHLTMYRRAWDNIKDKEIKL